MLSLHLTKEKILNFVTCLGASVVIIGAMFKIMHWEGANTMLTIGLITEASIFFLYAFFPPKEVNSVQPLEEYLPKRVNAETGIIETDTLSKFNQNLSTTNKNLSDFNNLIEKIKLALKS